MSTTTSAAAPPAAATPRKVSIMQKLMGKKPKAPAAGEDESKEGGAGGGAAAATAAESPEPVPRLKSPTLVTSPTAASPDSESQTPGGAATEQFIRSLASAALSVVVVGASGDLAKKKTYPALFALFIDGFIPPHTTICGYARSAKEDAGFREHLKPFLMKCKGATEENVAAFVATCIYRSGQYDSAEGFAKVHAELLGIEAAFAVANRLFYLAIPPSVFVPSAQSINAACRTTAAGGWNRIIVEKPFGTDSDSSAELSRGLAPLFGEEEIFRIDHYLGKEMVQNLIILRFANTWLEPLWNRNYISNVIITFKEDIGTMGRGGYFDTVGIIRDVMQNHLLQVLSIAAMEPPVCVSGDDGNFVRDEKVKVLRSIAPITLDECVIGQYTANEELGEPGYLDDETVPAGSNCPTYAAAVLHINNPRWEGVPFVMKAGKGLNERKAEVRIQFKDPPGGANLFQGQETPRNELVLRLQPDEAVYMKTNVKMPGLSSKPGQVEMDLSYGQRFAGAKNPDAYTRLILDVLRGKQSGFVRNDELKAAWDIFTPLLHAIDDKSSDIKPIPYTFGSRGPIEADHLVERSGFKRYDGYQWSSPL